MMYKRFSAFFLALFILSTFALSAFAYDGEDDTEVSTVDIEELISDLGSEDNPIQVSSEEELPPDVYLVDVQLTSVGPVTPSDTSGLKSVLLSLLGDYDPIIAEYRYMNQNSSYYSYLREVQPDYVWIAAAVMLGLVIYCLFRLGGAILGD